MSYYSDQKVADDFTASRMSCRVCGASTPLETLAGHGGLCRPCFDLYCAQAPGKPNRSPREALRQLAATLGKGTGAIGTQWAYRLRERHQAGETLSRFQIDCYERAIGSVKTIAAAQEGADIPREDIDRALRATGDLPSAQFEPWWDGLDIPAFEAEA